MPEAPTHPRALRLGTRGSQLARWQAEWVAEKLRQRGQLVELIEISTRGDLDAGRPIEEIGTRGVFTKEIQRALLAGAVDLAVHSLKDLPTEPVAGLILAVVPPRESPADVLVARTELRSKAVAGVETAVRTPNAHAEGSQALDPSHAEVLNTLPFGARVGTGSLRRQAQLRHARPDLQTVDIRGNVDTRLRKLDAGQFEAIVLAEAGLRRLGLASRITQVLPFELMLPAVGQGALGIECRADDTATQAALAPLDDGPTHAAVLAERALLARLRGGCMAPVGALAQVDDGGIAMSAVVLSADGLRRIAAHDLESTASAPLAIELGRRVADSLIAQGAAELIAAARS